MDAGRNTFESKPPAEKVGYFELALKWITLYFPRFSCGFFDQSFRTCIGAWNTKDVVPGNKMSLTYPAFKLLPPELISEVFFAYVQLGNDWDSNWSSNIHRSRKDNTNRSRPSPLLLCRVSSSWRAIATTTPRLWWHLSIYREVDVTAFSKLVVNWFGRAGDLPLSLSILNWVLKPVGNGNQHDLEVKDRVLRESCTNVWPRLHNLHIDMVLYPPIWVLNTLLRSAVAVRNLSLNVDEMAIVPRDFVKKISKLGCLRMLQLTSDEPIDEDCCFPFEEIRTCLPGHVQVEYPVFYQLLIT